MSELNKQSRCSGDDTCRQRMTCADFAGRVLEVRDARVKQEADARAGKNRKAAEARKQH